MKQINFLTGFVAAMMLLSAGSRATAQQYKLRQVSSSMGMKSESTVYVKGNRKRTESSGYAGMNKNLVTIEQCDKQRAISLNTKKKLYFIETFSNRVEEITDDNIRPAVKTRPGAATKSKGGTIYSHQNIIDTGERKKMFGMVARHVWSTQKIKPSADACMMKDSLLMKTDGWYIDLPDFNCYSGGNDGGYGGGYDKPDCQDLFVTKRTGKGKLGFPLIETRTIIMGGISQTSEFKTEIETLEFSNTKLDTMLFEIPEGYTETKDRTELNDPFDVSELSGQYNNGEKQSYISTEPISKEKGAGIIRIAVVVPNGGGGELDATALQLHLVNSISKSTTEAVAVSSIVEAREYNCDFLLTTEFAKIKQGSKIGGLLKAVKNADPTTGSSFSIEANLLLTTVASGIIKSQQAISGKFNGSLDVAVMSAVDMGCGKLIHELR